MIKNETEEIETIIQYIKEKISHVELSSSDPHTRILKIQELILNPQSKLNKMESNKIIKKFFSGPSSSSEQNFSDNDNDINKDMSNDKNIDRNKDKNKNKNRRRNSNGDIIQNNINHRRDKNYVSNNNIMNSNKDDNDNENNHDNSNSKDENDNNNNNDDNDESDDENYNFISSEFEERDFSIISPPSSISDFNSPRDQTKKTPSRRSTFGSTVPLITPRESKKNFIIIIVFSFFSCLFRLYLFFLYLFLSLFQFIFSIHALICFLLYL